MTLEAPLSGVLQSIRILPPPTRITTVSSCSVWKEGEGEEEEEEEEEGWGEEEGRGRKRREGEEKGGGREDEGRRNRSIITTNFKESSNSNEG